METVPILMLLTSLTRRPWQIDDSAVAITVPHIKTNISPYVAPSTQLQSVHVWVCVFYEIWAAHP